MSLLLGEDSWLLEYESCEKLHRDIKEFLSQREQFPRTSDKYSKISVTIRLRLKQYSNEVDQLNQKLEIATNSGSITLAESERRVRQIEKLQTKGVQMQKLFDDQGISKYNEDRRQLMGSSSATWESDVPSIANRSVDQLKSDQKRMLGEQEEGLENLSQIISRQKNIARTITNEVDYHNEILSDLGTQIDSTDYRVRNETSHITAIDSKDKTCIYWVVIILLFLSIVVVASVL